jgi:two-component SAPR family response regulator
MELKVLIFANDISLKEFINIALVDEMGVNVVGITSDPSQAIRKCQTLKPDLILVDVEISILIGFDITNVLRVISPSIKIIYIGKYDKGVYNDLLKSKFGADYIQQSNFVKEIQVALKSIKNGRH